MGDFRLAPIMFLFMFIFLFLFGMEHLAAGGSAKFSKKRKEPKKRRRRMGVILAMIRFEKGKTKKEDDVQ